MNSARKTPFQAHLWPNRIRAADSLGKVLFIERIASEGLLLRVERYTETEGPSGTRAFLWEDSSGLCFKTVPDALFTEVDQATLNLLTSRL